MSTPSPPATPGRRSCRTSPPRCRSLADGLTYTFTLKDGVTFGPPVNREVTSQDIKYSFERIGTPSVAAQYAFYYNVIEGMEEFAAGEANTISGITTPDDKTITFKLTQPTGDFLYRMAMPATAPIPEEVARCHTQAAEYGRYIVTTGPHDRGRRQARHLELRQPEADLGLQPNRASRWCATRATTRRPTTPSTARATPTGSRSRSTPTSTTSSTRSSAASWTPPSSSPEHVGATCRTRRSASACASTRATGSGSPT